MTLPCGCEGPEHVLGVCGPVAVAAPITHAVELTDKEIEFLRSALDSHEYWQLSDSGERNNGASLIEDDEDPDVDFGRAIAHRLYQAQEGRATPPAVRGPDREEDEDDD